MAKKDETTSGSSADRAYLHPKNERLEIKPLPLRVELTPEERLQKGIELAALVHEHSSMLDAHKVARAGLKAELEEVNGRVLACRVDVASCSEVRSVDCEVVADFDRGLVETIRLDTGKVVSSRPIQDSDRQRVI